MVGVSTNTSRLSYDISIEAKLDHLISNADFQSKKVGNNFRCGLLQMFVEFGNQHRTLLNPRGHLF